MAVARIIFANLKLVLFYSSKVGGNEILELPCPSVWGGWKGGGGEILELPCPSVCLSVCPCVRLCPEGIL